jgi:hypothetical protein
VPRFTSSLADCPPFTHYLRLHTFHSPPSLAHPLLTPFTLILLCAATAALVKRDCPDAFLYYNEGGAPLWGNYNVNHMHTEYPHIPAAVDFVSTDDYAVRSNKFNDASYSQLQTKPLLLY